MINLQMLRYTAEKYEAQDTKRKFGIKLTTVEKVFELFATTERARNLWLEVLNEDLKVCQRGDYL